MNTYQDLSLTSKILGLLCYDVTMRFAALSLCLASLAPVAFGSVFEFRTRATAYQGTVDDSTTLNLDQWQAANRQIDQMTVADGYPLDPPHSDSKARIVFDQTQPEDASLRMFARSGRAFSQTQDPIEMVASAHLGLVFDLVVENLSGEHLSIAIANKLHGTMATFMFSEALVSEITHIGWFGSQSGSLAINQFGTMIESGIFQGTTKASLVEDEYFVLVQGWEFNSFHFYGHRLFAPGEVATTTVRHAFDIRVGMSHMYELGLVNMMNTGNFKVLAFDQFGNDRTADIRVGIVPEPGTFIAVGLGLATLVRRRRNR